ncbi:MAG: hypothetical protein Q9222_006218, partial [Ikaeria aurantiellina]
MSKGFAPIEGGGSLILAWQIKGKRVLVVGGGEVAAGRILNVLNADAKVTVVSPREGLNDEVAHRVDEKQVDYVDRKFEPSDLDDADMVLTAIDDPEASTTIWKLCKEKKVAANIADVPPECDFYFGSVHRDGPLQIMVSTNGNGPKLASIVRKQIAANLPDNIGAAIQKVGMLRRKLRKVAPATEEGPKRMQWMSKVCESWSLEDLVEMDEEDMEKLLESYRPGEIPSFDRVRLGDSFEDYQFDGSFGWCIYDELQKLNSLRQVLLQELSVDGEAVYHLVPNVELFSLAKCLLNHPALVAPDAPTQYQWARVTVNFWHQKLLNENVSSLQEAIYRDLDALEQNLRKEATQERVHHFIQRATIHTLHGHDHKAREDLKRATEATGFEFKLTGRLGKRTKFQVKDHSQLVVLAKSADPTGKDASGHLNGETKSIDLNVAPRPQNLDLNDDTLLESIAFSAPERASSTGETSVSPSLAALEPSNQPKLKPLDAIILLAYASSITNTSPADGLTREETLPYATRVLQDGSTNWQVYTQALLVRSRIEGYKSRTIERGILQLQALVDQVIVETTGNASTNDPVQEEQDSAATSFLPRPKPSESAPVSERLQYIHLLASPARWELEAELASRWVSLGGLRTALEIYERLQMWAEVALCWAANDHEDKARTIIRRQLFTSPSQSGLTAEMTLDIDYEDTATDDLTSERSDLPADAPRLFCILGDLEKSPAAYERAWKISNHRYARAQRSLGKYYFTRNELHKTDEAYVKSLKVNPLNHPTWFSLGCVRLQTENWAGAVTAFARAIQIEDTDAESWSNMAAALVQLPPEVDVNDTAESGSQVAKLNTVLLDDDDNDDSTTKVSKIDPQRHLLAAFTSLKRAAALKRESHRIWQNLLAVAVKLSPPPYTDILIAETRIIDLRAKVEGEKCIDIEVLEHLVQHLIATTSSSPSATTTTAVPSAAELEKHPNRGFENMLLSLLFDQVAPLITQSRRLHLLLARTHLYLGHP